MTSLRLQNLSLPLVLIILFCTHSTSASLLRAFSNESKEHLLSTRALDQSSCSDSSCGPNSVCNSRTSECECKDNYFGVNCTETFIVLMAGMISNSNITLDQSAYFYLDMTDAGKDLTLSITYTPSSLKLTYLFLSFQGTILPNAQNNNVHLLSPDSQATWQIKISKNTVNNFPTGRLMIDIHNDGTLPTTVQIQANYMGSSNLVTVVAVVFGAVGVILNVAGCVYFIRYKLKQDQQSALAAEGNIGTYTISTVQTLQLYRRSEMDNSPLTYEDLNLYFPQNAFNQLKNSFALAECTICLEEFTPDAVCRQLYCDHIFHADCIQLWLGKNQSCPVCKKTLQRSAICAHMASMKKQENHDEQDTQMKFLALTPKALSSENATHRIEFPDQEQNNNNEFGLHTTSQPRAVENGEEEKNDDPNQKEYRDSGEDYDSPDCLKAPRGILELETVFNLDTSMLNDHQCIKDGRSEVGKETLSLSKKDVETAG